MADEQLLTVTEFAEQLGLTARALRFYEDKGLLARDTRPEHVDDSGAAYAALPAGRDAPDLWCVAAARLVALGGTTRSRFLAPAGAWLAGRLEGEPLECALARVYFGRVLPSAADAATRPEAWRSPLVTAPARALLARAVWESATAAGRRVALLALVRCDPPGTLDSLCASAGVAGARVAGRYRALADSLARLGRHALALRQPVAWRPTDGFMRGVCLAHDARLEEGYASAACARTLRTLRDAGTGWVSLTPFGYVPEGPGPGIWPSAEGGPDEENDESIAEAAARALALGMKVWLVPHLWSRSWPGALTYTSQGWTRFLDRYREFALHYALLADRDGTLYYDGKQKLLIVDKQGTRTEWPLPDRATGSADPYLVESEPGRFFLFNEPGRLLRLRRTPAGPDPFKLEATFSRNIPNVSKLTRMWVDPKGRIAMVWDEKNLAIAFPQGFIPMETRHLIPAEVLDQMSEDKE